MSYQFAQTHGADGAPLIFTFHGTGGDETQFHNFGTRLLPSATVISPRGDVSEGGANRFFKRTGEGVYDIEDLSRRTAAMDDFVGHHKTALGATRVFGLGYSNGANILASLSFDRPDLFDDLILLHPLIPWRPAPQPALQHTRVLITAGQRDPICPPAQTKALAAFYSDQGAETQIDWHAGGHEIAQSEISAILAHVGKREDGQPDTQGENTSEGK